MGGVWFNSSKCYYVTLRVFSTTFLERVSFLALQLRVSLMSTVTESLPSAMIICEGHGDSNLVGSASKLCFLLFFL